MKARKASKQARVAAAIEDTREFLKDCRDRGLLSEHKGLKWRRQKKAELSRLDIYSHFCLPLEWNEESMRALAEQANRGEAEATRVLREAAAELLRQRQALPDSLSAWVSDYLADDRRGKRQSRRGRKPHANFRRDYGLTLAVKRMMREPWGFAPTRNRATTTAESACSIVHQALRGLGVGGLSERGIEKIWSLHRDVRLKF